jgi:serine/threonine-protein kinase
MIRKILKIAAFCALFIAIAGISAYFTLSLVIKSEDTVVVPDFIGEDVVSVLEVLTELGLNTKVRGSEYSSDIPKHHVIQQEPEPGAEIKKGRDVRILISKGTETVPMPNLIGLSQRQAGIIFDENDLCRGQVASTPDDTFEKEMVLAQVPGPGKLIRRGECVDLLVSTGRRPVAFKMPAVTGLLLAEALARIEQNRLSQGAIRAEQVTGKPARSVLEQDPPAGYRVAAATAVDLVVNRRRESAASTDAATGRIGSFFRYRTEDGYLRKHLRVQVKHPGFSIDLFDEFVRPGSDIWLILPTDEDATVLVYEDDKLTRTLIPDPWR